MTNKKKKEDTAPDWEALIPAMLASLSSSETPRGVRSLIGSQLRKMAKMVDEINSTNVSTIQPKIKEEQ